MPKSSHIQEFARIGAAVRIKELQEEIAEIRRTFPGLGGNAPAVKRKPGRPKAQAAESTEAAVPATPVKRTQRKMSAAARKRISDAQKARWAKVKKAKKP